MRHGHKLCWYTHSTTETVGSDRSQELRLERPALFGTHVISDLLPCTSTGTLRAVITNIRVPHFAALKTSKEAGHHLLSMAQCDWPKSVRRTAMYVNAMWHHLASHVCTSFILLHFHQSSEQSGLSLSSLGMRLSGPRELEDLH